MNTTVIHYVFMEFIEEWRKQMLKISTRCNSSVLSVSQESEAGLESQERTLRQ